MKARKLEQTCPDFAKVEEARLRYLYAQTMVMYPMGHQLMGGDPDYRPGREVYDAVGKMVVEREDLADVDVYRDFIHFAIPLVLEGQGREFGDPYTRTVATMRYVADNFTDEKVKQTMLRLLAIEYMQNNGVRNTAELQNIANAYITDPQMLREYKEEFESHDLTAPGALRPISRRRTWRERAIRSPISGANTSISTCGRHGVPPARPNCRISANW